jgi:hypothetical protein
MPTFKPGDRVAYTKAFVKRCAYGKCVADNRGTVLRRSMPVRGQPGKGFYAVQWDGVEGERTVLSTNIVHANKLHTEPA